MNSFFNIVVLVVTLSVGVKSHVYSQDNIPIIPSSDFTEAFNRIVEPRKDNSFLELLLDEPILKRNLKRLSQVSDTIMIMETWTSHNRGTFCSYHIWASGKAYNYSIYMNKGKIELELTNDFSYASILKDYLNHQGEVVDGISDLCSGEGIVSLAIETIIRVIYSADESAEVDYVFKGSCSRSLNDGRL
jgi:hypothetical protein